MNHFCCILNCVWLCGLFELIENGEGKGYSDWYEEAKQKFVILLPVLSVILKPSFMSLVVFFLFICSKKDAAK